jgi:hypothetical protein
MRPGIRLQWTFLSADRNWNSRIAAGPISGEVALLCRSRAVTEADAEGLARVPRFRLRGLWRVPCPAELRLRRAQAERRCSGAAIGPAPPRRQALGPLPSACHSRKWNRCISATGFLAAAAYNPADLWLCLDEVRYVESRRRYVHHDQRPCCCCVSLRDGFVGVRVVLPGEPQRRPRHQQPGWPVGSFGTVAASLRLPSSILVQHDRDGPAAMGSNLRWL